MAFVKYPFYTALLFFVIAFMPLLSAFTTGGNPLNVIDLQPERLSITPKEFYVSGLTDARDDKLFASIVTTNTATGKTENSPAELKGGITALKTYIDNSLPVDKKLRPIVITVKTLKIRESALGNGGINGQITLELSFSLQKNDELVHLTNYIGSAAYQRNAGPAQQVEPILRSTINKGLIYLNNWMNVQVDNNIKLAKGVNVVFEDYKETEEGDTIYYNISRPLKWTDFRAKPQNSSKYGAEVFASLGYNEDVKLIKGIINIKLAMKVYLPKSACWVKDFGAGDYHLNHEQRHFDIVKLMAERFKRQIGRMKLTTDNYDGPINVAYFDALREIDKMQKQYDGDTQHSINNYQQQQWCNKIDKELIELNVKTTAI